MSARRSSLGGRQHAAGDFGAHHLDAGLALAVDAEAQAEGAEIVVGDLAGEEFLGFGSECFDLGADGIVVLLLKFVRDGVVEEGVGMGHGETPYSL